VTIARLEQTPGKPWRFCRDISLDIYLG
jgi:hypothetical protein